MDEGLISASLRKSEVEDLPIRPGCLADFVGQESVRDTLKIAIGAAAIRAEDLAAVPIRALMDRHARADWAALEDVVYGCANQAGEDNRNVGRMAALLAGLPESVPGTTVNRLCGSSLDAVAIAARAIRCGEAGFVLAGGVESMTRAPFVMAKAEGAFPRAARLEDTTLGWRFVGKKSQYCPTDKRVPSDILPAV